MSDTQAFSGEGPNEQGRRAPGAQLAGHASASPDEPKPRAVGSPLPIGSGSRPALPAGPATPLRTDGAPPPTRAAGGPTPILTAQAPSGIQRAISAFRAALPIVQRILPLLDGNIGTAVSNVLTPRTHPAPAPPPQPPVNLAPITECLAELQTQQHELRDQVVEQNSSLKLVEDRLEMVRDATDRNTLEQQELMEDLKAVGRKVNLVAIVALVLLAASLALNVLLYLHVRHVLP
jgi:hypothetical protein